jgi:ribosomal protein S18 acetylase RimI-like enzyme
MIAKSFSTEFGKPCIWIEDLFLTEECRGLGLGRLMISYIEKKYQGAIFRLEVEEENERAMRLYRKCGFDVIPYTEMKK